MISQSHGVSAADKSTEVNLNNQTDGKATKETNWADKWRTLAKDNFKMMKKKGKKDTRTLNTRDQYKQHEYLFQ